MSRRLVRTRGPKTGQCNTCGDVGELTEDHSPPKSCVRPTGVQIRHIIHLLSDQGVTEKGRISQNGVKFRTLCRRCNSELLGSRYDPALAAFTRGVATVLASSLYLPDVINVPGRPQLIMRAVYGHLAAQGVERYLKGPDTEALREAFQNPEVPMPATLRFYYWLFPHQGCVLFRDAAISDLQTRNTAAIWLFKFFPVSFMLAWETTERPMFSLNLLSQWSNLPPDEEVDIPMPLRSVPSRHWPEAPTDTSIVVYGEEAMFAMPHVARK
jgi:hypothetical protein